MRRSLLLCSLLVGLVVPSVAQAHGTTYSWVRANCHAPAWCGWQATVDCENSGRWADSPGQFFFGLQFSWRTLVSAQRHTGVLASAYPPSQIVNAIWVRDEARRGGYPDPWPNCRNP